MSFLREVSEMTSCVFKCCIRVTFGAELESKHDFVVKVRDVVKTWKRPVFVVMRYLFAFLNHLSEFSDENLMDPYNLAICFGPTLVPIPEERDQVKNKDVLYYYTGELLTFAGFEYRSSTRRWSTS